MFGLKGRDTFNKPTSNFSDIVKKIGSLWVKFFPYILGVLVIGGLVIIGYVWHTYLYNKDVTEDEKKQYIDKKNKEVTFKKEKFNELKNEINLRSERFNAERVEYEDIFYHTVVVEEIVEDAVVIDKNL